MLGNIPDFSPGEQGKKKAIGMALALLLLSRLIYQKRQIKCYINGLCPNGRMSSIGVYRRNVINLNATFWWLISWCCAFLFCCISVDYGHNILSVRTQFWIWNISEFIGHEGLHLVLPFLLDFPSQGSPKSNNINFYLRKQPLEPRRPNIIQHSISDGRVKLKPLDMMSKASQYIVFRKNARIHEMPSLE